MIKSYIIYTLTVLNASIFASLAQKYSKVNKRNEIIPHKFFWMISMLILIIIMGFRKYSVGVDGETYIRMYNEINQYTFKDYYSFRTTEPGYYLLNKLVFMIFKDYQWLFVIIASITILFFYRSISYEIENISLGLSVFVFASTQYFYYFGIMRMGLAVSIVAYAYRYILENKKKKYFILVLLATSFHYSSLFALFGLFIKEDFYKGKGKSKIFLKMIILIPFAFMFIRTFIYPLISINRYQDYITRAGFLSSGFITTVPLFIIFTFFYKEIVKKGKNFQFYYLLLYIKLITELFGNIIGAGRMVWYVNISICFLFPAIVRLSKKKILKLGIILFTLIYSMSYSYYSYFGNSPRGQTMLPYENVLFD